MYFENCIVKEANVICCIWPNCSQSISSDS